MCVVIAAVTPVTGGDGVSAAGSASFSVATSPALTLRERRAVAACPTPRALQRWLRRLPYNRERRGDTLRSFRGALARGRAHCLEAVFIAAALQYEWGRPPLVLDLESQDGLDHVLWLYRHDGRWGAVARSRDEGLHGRPAVYPTVRALAESYLDPYVDATGRIVGYGVADLDTLTRADWRFGDGDVWAVERALIRMPHKRLRMPEQRYRAMHARYEALSARWGKPTRRTLRRFYGAQVSQWW
jgi:hypothetical protein